jgi:hypothetical protein
VPGALGSRRKSTRRGVLPSSALGGGTMRSSETRGRWSAAFARAAKTAASSAAGCGTSPTAPPIVKASNMIALAIHLRPYTSRTNSLLGWQRARSAHARCVPSIFTN